MLFVLTFLGVWKKKTLFHYLANGESFAYLGYLLRVGRIRYRALYVSPKKSFGRYCNQYTLYIRVRTSEERLRIADEFNEICKMLNCTGSIDGKQRRIKCPPNAGSLYFNYKSFHSINLSGVAVANCCFTLIDVGAHGCGKDSSVFVTQVLERRLVLVT